MSKLTLSREDAKIWGVCSGIAKWSNIDVSVVRILFAVGTIIGVGSLILIYILLAMILD
ncbi:PspC domain-containing protein [Sphingorhabdus lutea]|nr:PspC domain-containing protein [Sphingorhabdus lutea]